MTLSFNFTFLCFYLIYLIKKIILFINQFIVIININKHELTIWQILSLTEMFRYTKTVANIIVPISDRNQALLP